MKGGLEINDISPKTPLVRNKDSVLLEWSGLSFEKKPKGLLWYTAAILVFLVIVGYSFWAQDWFVIIITPVIAVIVFWYTRTVKPTKVKYAITPLGISANEKNYPFSEIHSFWIVYNDSVQKLYIAFTKKYLPALTVTIEEVDPILLRGILSKKIPEQEKRGEGLLDALVRMIGF